MITEREMNDFSFTKQDGEWVDRDSDLKVSLNEDGCITFLKEGSNYHGINIKHPISEMEKFKTLYTLIRLKH